MDGQELAALSVVALTMAAFAWRWWHRRRRAGALPCAHCCGGNRARPASLHLHATQNGPAAIGLKPPAP